jgi:hypothetical protein
MAFKARPAYTDGTVSYKYETAPFSFPDVLLQSSTGFLNTPHS